MKIGLLSNERMARNINWTTLSDPLYTEIEAITPAVRLTPPSLSLSALPDYFAQIRKSYQVDALFGMNGHWRPSVPLAIVSALRGPVLRAAFYVDPWRPQIAKIRAGDRYLRNDLSFIPYREAMDLLEPDARPGQYRYLPFAADTTVFKDRGLERDIDILSMGRRYEPLHRAILDYADANGLTYMFRERTGFIEDPQELGRLASRARYFVCTPTDLNPLRPTGGFSPLVMRYFEGLAAGCRLLGALPKSGEYEKILPREAILEVAPDGSDFAQKFARDSVDPSWQPAVAAASRDVIANHGWDARARIIIAAIKQRLGRA